MVGRLSDLDYTALYGRYAAAPAAVTTTPGLIDACPCPARTATLVDRSRRLPAMLTLTYPGDWLTFAQDGQTVKRHFTALAKRYERAWGEPLVCIWKLMFEARGAPHLHLSTSPPMGLTVVADPDIGDARSVDFRTWLSITWADIVAHPDPDERRRHRAAGPAWTTPRASVHRPAQDGGLLRQVRRRRILGQDVASVACDRGAVVLAGRGSWSVAGDAGCRRFG
jgi:hypothetical protein